MVTAATAAPTTRYFIERPWLTVLLFLACLSCSYVDRQIISILVEPLKADLGLSDTQIGLLQGFAFSICYAVMGVPIARALDRGDRIGISAACVVVWSISAGACGFVGSFGALLAARACTAVAEAGLPPAGLSLISDAFRRERISRATAVFMLGPYVGTGIALLAGGWLLRVFSEQGGLQLPGIGVMAPWRATFLVIAAPGLILAVVLRSMLVDSRHAVANQDLDSRGGLLQALRQHGGFLWPYYGGVVLSAMALFALTAWMPTYYIRVLQLPAASVGKMLGPIYLLAGLAGSVLAIVLSSRGKGEPLPRILLLMTIAAILLAFAAAAAPLTRSLAPSLLFFGVAVALSGLTLALIPVPLQLIAPPEVRAQIIALGGFLVGAGSAGGGPFFVGALTDHVFADPMRVGSSIALVSSAAALLAVVALTTARSRVSPENSSDAQDRCR